MKKLLLTFTLLFSTLMFSSPSYGEWTKVSENVRVDTFYVDFERIKKRGEYVYYWVLLDYIKQTKHGHFSARIYNQGDCKILGVKFLSDYYHTKPMGEGQPSVRSNVPDKNWTYPPPKSSWETLLKEVCSQ